MSHPAPETAPPGSSLKDALAEIERALAEGQNLLRIFGTQGSLGPALGAHAFLSTGRAVVYVTADDRRAEAAAGDLAFFLPAAPASEDPLANLPVDFLPDVETSPYVELQADRRVLHKRLALLAQLAAGRGPRVLACSMGALFRKVMARAELESLCHEIPAGVAIRREDLVARLLRAGYARVEVVEDPGTFAVRGAVVDLFPPVYHHPVRLELFGDEVESVRLFDGATQRTLRPLSRVVIHPARETLRTAGADPRARILAAADAAEVPSSRVRHLLEQIENGESFFGIESYAPVFHREMVPLLEYLPDQPLFVLEDPEGSWEELRRGFSNLRESAERRRAEHRLALDPEAFVVEPDRAHALIEAQTRLELPLIEVLSPSSTGASVRITCESNTSLRAELAQRPGPRGAGENDASTDFGQTLRGWLGRLGREGFRVLLVAHNRTHADRLRGLLAALGLPVGKDSRPRPDSGLLGLATGAPRGLEVTVGGLSHGFRLPGDGLAVISETEIFGSRIHRQSQPKRVTGLSDLGELAEGDLAVHEDHGVGRYRGLKKLEVKGVAQDFLHLEYDGGNIYLPIYRIGAVRRYVGGDASTVRLDKVGGRTWQEKRRRVSAEARKVAEELLQLYAQRRALPGHAYPAPDVVYREFEETFPFDETPDQEKAIEAVIADLQTPLPMDRLVCGDVGYGKTEVALRAALLAVLGGKQVAVLAPTTVLAEQHFVTFSERFADFPVRLGSLSRFRSKEQQKKTIAALAEGRMDVVIGTHRILSRDVRFAHLGLIVVDEEQRFGVAHKERLKEMRSQVDVLTLTATPIPRTMQMAMSGLREISIIATPPADRLAIRTFLCQWDETLLAQAIAKELARGGQVFFVHNRIQDLPKWVERVRVLAPQARVAMAHGQMAEGELEKIMIDFVDGRYDVLASTTIIESGLDIPRANTMIVNHAERFGLAQLYQLRGRIGRSTERAFCYLVVPSEQALSVEAKQRLAVLSRFTELGAGFQIATHDLEIRGAGDLLGERQHGLVAAVGFDTYVRILEDAVAELRGQPIRHEHDPEVTVDVPAFLPDDYVPDAGQRLELYRRLAQAKSEDEIADTVSELTDRYGPLPEEASMLAEVMAQKTLLGPLGARGYELSPQRLSLTFDADSPLSPAKVLALVEGGKSGWKLSPEMRLTYTFTEADKRERLAAARRCLERLSTCKA